MEQNPLSSRKITIRMPSREGNPSNTQNNKLTNSINSTTKENPLHVSSGDNFFRKSVTKGFYALNRSENYGIMKSDLFQLQEMINENSYLTKMYKITSKSPSFTKRLLDIEDNKDIKLLIEKINDDAININQTGKIYNCSNTNELIQKLTLDVFYLETLLKKINEYCLVLHLKIGGDDNLYQETHSKFLIIKLVIEKLLEKNYSIDKENIENIANQENEKIKIDSNKIINENNNLFLTEDSKNNNITDEEFNNFLKIESMSDIIKDYKNSENKILKHLANIYSEFVEKLNSNYNGLIHKFTKNNFKNNLQLDGFLTQKLIIEKIIYDKDKDNENLKNNINEQKLAHFTLEERINFLEKELNKLNIEKIKNDEIKNNQHNEPIHNIEDKDNNSLQGLVKIIEENNKVINCIKKPEDIIKSKLYDEVKKITTKYEDTYNKYTMIQQENIELVKKINFLSNNTKKDLDFESYEQLMNEQFENMKTAFVQKIEKLNEEVNSVKIESRRKINSVQEDLIQVTYVKDLFLKQITDLQKRLQN